MLSIFLILLCYLFVAGAHTMSHDQYVKQLAEERNKIDHARTRNAMLSLHKYQCTEERRIKNYWNIPFAHFTGRVWTYDSEF